MTRARNKAKPGKLKKWMLCLNLAAVLLLVLTYITPYVRVSAWGWLSLLALAYPFTLLANGLFALGWLFFRKRYALLSLASIIAGYQHHGQYLQLFPGRNNTACTEPVHILSYNLRGLSMFPGALKNKGVTGIDSLYEALAVFHEYPDILCLQEAQYGEEIARKFGMEHVIHAPRSTLWLVSRYPVMAQGVIEGAETGPCAMWADIKTPRGTLRVYNIHLVSNRVSQTTQELMEDMTQPNENTWNNLLYILRRYKTTTKERAGEAGALHVHVQQSPYPVVIAGDANDTPLSYVYSVLSDGLHDSFSRKGSGLSTTYDGPLPLLRIDYILADGRIMFTDHHTYKLLLSDHFPVSAGVCIVKSDE